MKTVQRRLTGDDKLAAILVGVDQAYDTAQVQASLTSLLRQLRHLQPGQDDNFFIFDTKQISDTLSSTTTLLTRIVTAVAGISLVVGGIGIMNIMLVSVTERTREIGIRLAIGAVASEVLTQFLVEAVALSMLGGVIGLLVAQLAIGALSALGGLPFLFVPEINLLAFGISALIGVVFGYFPARRAAALNPIDALRHE
jgi:putative ABC transport system permease protein